MAVDQCTGLRSKIESERRRLQRACAVLTCLQCACDEEIEVDAGDVAHVARELVLAALQGLDTAMLYRTED